VSDKCPKCGANEYQPPAATVLDWLHSNLGGRALAPLTGTDTKALRAAVQIMEAYGYDRSSELLHAFCLVVRRMQPHCRELAYHAIAHPLDWSDRKKLWAAIANAKLVEPLDPSMTCSFEPGGSHIDYASAETV
jgi:hypothetical protein